MTLSRTQRLLLVISLVGSVACTTVGALALPNYFFARSVIGDVNQWSIRSDVARLDPAGESPVFLSIAQHDVDKAIWATAIRDCAFGQMDLVRLMPEPRGLADLSRVVDGYDTRIECRTNRDWTLIVLSWLVAFLLCPVVLFQGEQIALWIRRGAEK